MTYSAPILVQDCPPEFEGDFKVIKARPGGTICGPCYYVQRGSFPGSSQLELGGAIKEHKGVNKKFLVFLEFGSQIDLYFFMQLQPSQSLVLGILDSHLEASKGLGLDFRLQRLRLAIIRSWPASTHLSPQLTLRLRFKCLRRLKVRNLTLKPKKKQRREKVNLPELIKKSEKSYVDFQQARSSNLFHMLGACKAMTGYVMNCELGDTIFYGVVCNCV